MGTHLRGSGTKQGHDHITNPSTPGLGTLDAATLAPQAEYCLEHFLDLGTNPRRARGRGDLAGLNSALLNQAVHSLATWEAVERGKSSAFELCDPAVSEETGMMSRRFCA